ncbi:MAG: hypothetical protein JNL08_08160 [Planctomycetes bacterium]|nr:hypothetical protein [Planctomycetota bacterium]
MKSLIVKVVVGLLLFAGSLVGGLAATGRLNHEGTANIPLLNSFFPAPPAPPADEHAADAAHGADGPAPVDATHDGSAATPADAGAQEPQTQEPEKPVRRKVGKSVVEPEKPAGDGHGGGGHGEAAEGGDHGGGGHGGEHAEGEHGKPAAEHAPPAAPHGEAAVRGDLQQIEQDLAGDRHTKYAPGKFFRFDGMPAGLTPEQLNEAWQRVQGVMAEIERRKVALDLREQELHELADDISRRQAELGAERTKIDQLHRDLDARIQKFQDQVKLVRNDEVAALKRNAQTLASFESSKAAEILMEQWKTEQGQDEILKLLEFMDKDKVNEVLAALPNPMVQDVLKKRMRVTKEPAATDGRR